MDFKAYQVITEDTQNDSQGDQSNEKTMLIITNGWLIIEIKKDN